MSELNEQVRYFLEHKALPEELYSDHGGGLVVAILKERGKFFVQALNILGKEEGYTCPYSEDDYVFKPQLIRGKGRAPDLAILEIDMPEPERMPLCSRVYICHDDKLDHIRYYTVERTYDGSSMLCGWDQECHSNYGPAPSDEKELFLKIYGMYLKYLVGSIDSSTDLPSDNTVGIPQ